MSRVIRMVLLLVMALLVIPVVGFAQEFSADIISRGTAAGDYEGKIYVSGDKVRIEMPQAVTIVRIDKQVSWVMPVIEKSYTELPVSPEIQVSVTTDVPGEGHSVGAPEMMEGKKVQKVEIFCSLPGKKKLIIFQWAAEGDTYPLKTMALDKSWSIEFRNVKEGKQDASLFEIPPGYQQAPAPPLT